MGLCAKDANSSFTGALFQECLVSEFMTVYRDWVSTRNIPKSKGKLGFTKCLKVK